VGFNSFTVAEAKELLSGPSGLFDSVKLGEFLFMAQNNLFGVIAGIYPMLGNPQTAGCLGGYLSSVILQQAVVPNVQQAFSQGGGYFTKRTAREWLFTARDPLLVLLGQANPGVGFVGNRTMPKEEAFPVAARVYTGKNDLYWSLMPPNAGEELAYWRTPVAVTGYNGSQFLTDGYLDDAEEQRSKPLVLWHPRINRPIPFKNAGKDKWNGVHVRYLTLEEKALLNERLNPDNLPFYAEYSGVINKTSNPNTNFLPVFLTTPDFLSAEPAFYENVTFTDTIYPDYDPKEPLSRHRKALFLLTEPTLGATVWGNLPIQVNLKYQPTSLFPNLKPSVAPVYWNAIGDIATKKDLDTIKTTLYGNIRIWKALIGVGVGVGVPLLVAGIVLTHHFRKHEYELKDSTASTS